MSAVSFLICDPSPALQTFFHQQLTHYGFDAAAIQTAASPQSAAEMAITLQPDLLITDWFAKDGLDAPALFREVSQFCPGCRPAMMAQGVGPEHEQQAHEVGALFLLNKPFTADAARSALAQALEELAKTHPPIAQRLHARQHEAAAHMHRPVQIQLPPMHHYKPGDAVMYRNRTERVQHVILRRGEMVIQLQGVPGMVEADRIHPL